MFLSLIVAMDRNRVIGNNNQLPWHLSPDLKHFKAVTMGKPILMGRITYESIGKPLPGRRNIVISRNPRYEAPGCETYVSLDQVIAVLSQDEEKIDEVVVIGGMGIYNLVAPLVSRMYITEIDAEFEGDAWFPVFDKTRWKCVESEPDKDPESGLSYRFLTYERDDRSFAHLNNGTKIYAPSNKLTKKKTST